MVVLPHREDWRAATGLIRTAGPSPTTPVLFRVGLVETRKIPDEREIAADSPFLCPLSKYPIPGRVIVMPLHLNDEATQYVQELSVQLLDKSDRFFFLGRGTEDPYSAWLSGWFLSRGFKVSRLGNPEGVSVLVFERPNDFSRKHSCKMSVLTVRCMPGRWTGNHFVQLWLGRRRTPLPTVGQLDMSTPCLLPI